MKWFINPLRKFADFKGRESRQAFWLFILFSELIYIALAMSDAILATYSPEMGIGLNSAIFALVMLIPSLAITTRRLHDVGKSGWYQLLWLIPIVGWAILLYLLVQPSQPEENQYGPVPQDDE